MDPSTDALDELARALQHLGLDGSEIRRLEETARLCEKLEWKMARGAHEPPRDPDR